MSQNTMVAIATAQVEGAISILRLSGEDAISIADSIFRSKQKLRIAKATKFTMGKLSTPKQETFWMKCL